MAATRPRSLLKECLYVAAAGFAMVLVWFSSADNQAFDMRRLIVAALVAVIGLPLAWAIGRKTGVIR